MIISFITVYGRFVLLRTKDSLAGFYRKIDWIFLRMIRFDKNQ